MGACTQLRDMALACGLLAVAELRANGEGAEDAEGWLKRSLQPKPNLVTARLWRATYDLCWATSRYTCFLYTGDEENQNKAKQNWIHAASICFGRSYNMEFVEERFLSFQTDETF